MLEFDDWYSLSPTRFGECLFPVRDDESNNFRIGAFAAPIERFAVQILPVPVFFELSLLVAKNEVRFPDGICVFDLV